MLDGWGDHPVVAQTLVEASDALGENIGQLIQQGPKEALALTTNTQPVMLVAGVAAWRVWQAEGGALPDVVAGHSLGEYSALVASGVLTLAQAAPLVRLRAAAMQEAVPVGTGAMAAILGLDADKVRAGCAEVTAALGGAEVVEAVNFNDPSQTVIAGSKAAVEKACEALGRRRQTCAAAAGVGAFPFQPDEACGRKLKAALAATVLAAPRIPVLNNIDVTVQQDADAIRDALYRQAFGPVRWVECVQAMKARGVVHLVECGPGKVLMGLTKRIDADLTAAALYDPATLADVKESLA